jgi:hypothetical protein
MNRKLNFEVENFENIQHFTPSENGKKSTISEKNTEDRQNGLQKASLSQ